MDLAARAFARRHKAVVAVIAAAVVAVVLCIAYMRPRPVFGDGRVDVVCRETVILRKSDPVITRASFTYSRDSSRCAYVVRRGNKSRVVVDGIEGPEYDDAGCWETNPPQVSGKPGSLPNLYICMAFSHDGKHVAYAARQQGKEFMVIDGVPQAQCDGLQGGGAGGGGNSEFQYSRDTPILSEDGRHLAYCVKRNGEWYVVADGAVGKAFDEIEPHGPVYSKDGLHLAYAGKKGPKWVAVVDGVEGKEYDACINVRFSPDGNHLAYAARTGTNWCAVCDGVEGKPYGNVKWVGSYMTFAPDSKHFLYTAQQSGVTFFVFDGKEGKRYSNVFDPQFGPDGEIIAYGADANLAQRVVTRGVEGKPYRDIAGITANRDGGSVAYSAQEVTQWCAVVNGAEGPAYAEILKGPVFSPDGSHVIYSARTEYNFWSRCCGVINSVAGRQILNAKPASKGLVVVDGVAGTMYDSVDAPGFMLAFMESGDFQITPDGKHLVYTALHGGTRVIVVDGIEHPCPSRTGTIGKINYRSVIDRNGDKVLVEASITDR